MKSPQTQMWHLGTWLSGRLVTVGFVVGLDDLTGLSNLSDSKEVPPSAKTKEKALSPSARSTSLIFHQARKTR